MNINLQPLALVLAFGFCGFIGIRLESADRINRLKWQNERLEQQLRDTTLEQRGYRDGVKDSRR